MDINIEIRDIKQQQEKIIAMLNDLIDGKSQEKIYDAVDLMKKLNVSKRLIANWKEMGILPHTQVRGKMWVTETQLRTFLEKYSNDPRFTDTLKNKIGGMRNE